jgi:superfamily II DNA or RNA helicase
MTEPARLSFDRGTLLLRGRALDAGLAGLGFFWDERVGALRAPASRLESVRAWMITAAVDVVDGVQTQPPEPTGPWELPSLRPYQDAALETWTSSGRHGLIVLPTGAGKTRVAIAALATTRARALCLVPTRVLLQQWRDEIARFLGAPVGCLGDGTREVAPVTVSTFESALRLLPVLGATFDLLVIDEVHHFGGGVKDDALEMSTASMRLGLTATPPSEEALVRLGELVGPVVFERTVGDLAGSWLAPFDIIPVHVALEPEERRAYDLDVAEYRAMRARIPVDSWMDFMRSASQIEEGRSALAAHRRAIRLIALTRRKRQMIGRLLTRHRDARVLLFTADNAAAYEIARENLVMPITCDIGRAEREDVLARFRTGELRALVSSRVLNEGLDVPDADVAIVVGGTRGHREHIQRIGRLLRPAPGKRALVYELVAAGTSETYRARDRRAAFLLSADVSPAGAP